MFSFRFRLYGLSKISADIENGRHRKFISEDVDRGSVTAAC